MRIVFITLIRFFFFFFFWFGFYGPFKNISLISSRSFIEGGRKPENPEKNHLTIRKQNLAFPHMTRARLEPQLWETWWIKSQLSYPLGYGGPSFNQVYSSDWYRLFCKQYLHILLHIPTPLHILVHIKIPNVFLQILIHRVITCDSFKASRF